MNITANQIYEAVKVAHQDGFRRWIGASIIGHHCTRHIALKFRCAFTDDFPPRILRVFENGHRAEDRIVADLCKVHGVTVTARQAVIDLPGANGHAGVTLDGIVSYGGESAVLEMKTAKDSDFCAIAKQGVRKAKPQHYAQVQFAMLLAECGSAVYAAENKDTNELHIECVPFDKSEADRLARLALSIIGGHDGIKCSDKPTHWQCKMCPAHSLCHARQFPRAHCLTCCHATPAGGAQWGCAVNGGSVIPEDFLCQGCAEHVFLPWMVNLPVLDAGEYWVMYGIPDGGGVQRRLCNAAQAGGFPSVDSGPGPLILTSARLAGKTLAEVTSIYASEGTHL